MSVSQFDSEGEVGAGAGEHRPQRPLRWPCIPRTPTGWIVFINVVVFLLFSPGPVYRGFFPGWGEWLLYFGQCSLAHLQSGYFWTPVTSMFLHGGLIHLGANMLMIWFAGQMLQESLGTRRFLWLYFLSGLAGAALQVLAHNLPVHLAGIPVHGMVGASGAAFGLLLALAVLIPEQELLLLLYFIIPVRLRTKTLARALVIISVVFGFAYLALDLQREVPESDEVVATAREPDRGIWLPMRNVAHFAHLGGAIAGYLFMRFQGFGRGPVTLAELQRERARREAAATHWRPRGDAIQDAEIREESDRSS